MPIIESSAALLPNDDMCMSADCMSILPDLEPQWAQLSTATRIDWRHGGVRGDCVVGESDYLVPKRYCDPPSADASAQSSIPNFPSLERLRAADVHSAALTKSTFAQLASLLPNRTLVIMGDSVMEQTYNALQCMLRREGLELPVDRSFLDSMQANRPLWMMGTRKMAPKLPQRAITRRGLPPMRMLFARAVKFMAEDVRAALDTADVLVLNWGLHYHSMYEYQADLDKAFELFEGFVAARRGRAVLFRETGAQHFKGRDRNSHGEWDKRDLLQSNGGGPCSCAPLEDYHVNSPNRALRNVLAARRATSAVRILPFYALTRPRWRWHFGNCTNRPSGWGGPKCCDCTHWCYSPAFWEAHVHDLVVQLRAALCTDGVPCT